MSQEHLNTFAPTTPRQFTLAIVESVGARHDVTAAEILAQDGTPGARLRKVVAARHEAIAEVVEARPHWSYPTVGRFFGNRDHTSVMHALKKLGRWTPRKSNTNHASGVAAVRAVVAGLADMEGGAQ